MNISRIFLMLMMVFAILAGFCCTNVVAAEGLKYVQYNPVYYSKFYSHELGVTFQDIIDKKGLVKGTGLNNLYDKVGRLFDWSSYIITEDIERPLCPAPKGNTYYKVRYSDEYVAVVTELERLLTKRGINIPCTSDMGYGFTRNEITRIKNRLHRLADLMSELNVQRYQDTYYSSKSYCMPPSELTITHPKVTKYFEAWKVDEYGSYEWEWTGTKGFYNNRNYFNFLF